MIKLLIIIILLFFGSHQACTPSQFDAGGICQPCNATCATCTGSSSSDCSSCSGYRVLDIMTHTCPCQDGYKDVSGTCTVLACHYSCSACKNTQTFCTSCSSTAQRTLVSGSGTCPCVSKFFDAGIAACTGCHHTCQECSAASSTSCTSCNAVKFRVTDGAGGCKCMDKYYNQGSNELCSACNYKCMTCVTSSTNCLTCGANRGAAPTCACSQMFYDNGYSEACQACHYSCLTCTSASSCTSCDAAGAFRQLVSSTSYCTCLARYYEAAPNTLICSPCHNTCFRCTSNVNTACTSCSAAANRQISGTTCICKVGFYETAPNVQLCSPCHYTCRTCQTASTTCLTCSAALFRIFDSGTNTCPCMDGYFQSTQTGLCTFCHDSCKTCTNATQCLTCDTTVKLYSINSSNLCSCDDIMYFNTTLNKCKACATTCKTCEQTSPTLCMSCDTGRSLVSKSCPCLPYYFQTGATCSPCHYSCQTCNGLVNTNCLSCSSTNYRATVSGGQCLCKAGYYDNGIHAKCVQCSYQCGTCVDATTCATCDSSKFRSNPATMCPCVAGYFENSTLQCQKCSYYCIQCTDAVTCTVCNSSNRALNPVTLKCDCPSVGFYDNGVLQTCFACLPQCKTCTNSTKCTSCESSLFRYLTNNQKCLCIDKYFDLAGTCTLCDYYCATCTGSGTCVTCNSTANRVRDTVTGKCICKAGFYDTGIQQCQKCSYACTACITTANHCTACDTTIRTLNANWCGCKIQFYDNNITNVCPACQYTCGSCTNSTHCATCDVSKFRTFDPLNIRCACLDKFYDDGSNELCKACNYKCKTCSSSSACLTCDATKFRITPASMCPCMVKYYDSGLNSETCLPCHYSCATCTNSSECATCESTTNHRTYSPSTKKCKCMNKFYDDGSNEFCLACVYSCATCSSISSHCLTCSDSTTHRTLNANTCPCQSRYYDGNLDAVCQSCQYTCQTCSDGVSCDTCDSSKHRQHNVTDDLCHCVDGYFDDMNNHELCQQCHLTCVTCSDSLGCLTCDASKKRLLNSSLMYDGSTSNYCICQYGHYSPGDTLTCQPCHYSCEVCSGPGSSQCLYCDGSAHRILKNTSKCLCMNGYYDDGSNQLCLPCHTSCLTCFGPSITQCTSCINTLFLMVNQTTCFTICPNYHFENTAGMICSACDSHCLHCVNQNNCTQCQTGYYLYPLDRKCYSSCPNGYWKNTPLKLCDTCPNGCRTCLSNVKCYDCIQHYYFDTTVELCFSCYQNCKSCIGPGQDQCLSCYEPLYFKSNKCHNLTCPYGQYVDSVLGCKYCSDLFSNSLTCNKTEAFLCLDAYKLKDGQCKICSDVEGYHITPSTRTCSQICGDGKLFDYQCDDGNQLDGDGCSKNCIIENGWSCSASSIGSISVCRLESVLSMSLQRIQKYSGKNKVTLYFILSLPYRLVHNFTIITNDSSISQFSWKHFQIPDNLSSVQLTIDYLKSLQGKNLDISYDSDSATSRRLQHVHDDLTLNENQNIPEQKEMKHQRLLISTSISFSTALELTTFPPIDFYNTSEIEFFQKARQIIFYLALVLMVLSLVIIPKKTHLHSFTFSFIVAKVWLIFGLALEDKLDWVNHVLKDIKPWAMVGGFSMGPCCHNVSTFYEYKSELVSNSLFVLIAWVAVWMTLGVVYFINKFISKIEVVVQYVNYFAVTIHLVLGFHIFYSSLNSIYHYSIQNPSDAFNTTLSIAMVIFCISLLIIIWLMSYYVVPMSHQLQQYVVSHYTTFNVQNLNESNILPNSKKLMDFQNVESQQYLTVPRNNSYITQHNQVQQIPFETQTPKNQQKKDEHLSQKQLKIHEQKPLLERAKVTSQTPLLWDYQYLYRSDKQSSKYFLPITFNFLYIQILVIIFLAPEDKFYFIIVEGGLQVLYLIYMIVQRPFNSKYTNFRIIFISLMFMVMSSIMSYYLYFSQFSSYNKACQVAFIYICGITLLLAVVFCFLQHLFSWKSEIWTLIEPCFANLRWKDTKTKVKIHDLNPTFKTKQNIILQETESKAENILNSSDYDAFYMRMIKKEKVNQKYRRQRKMKQSIYSPY